MGAAVTIESVRHGYYPKGGGAVSLTVRQCKNLKPLLAEAPGRVIVEEEGEQKTDAHPR